MAELWDAYDKTWNKIEGLTLVRDEAIPDGIYHLVCDVAVKHRDGSYLLMQRDSNKHYGGMWELSAGGSALKGETAFDCALRELREETGITASNLDEIGRVVQDAKHCLFVECLCVTGCQKDAIVLQEGEMIDYRWVDRSSLLQMREQELVSARMMKFICELNL
ncbi:MAG: NUDIX domain-containing protein [Lachnospiraceae bacterium]|nr:NUDIX domain-containing protein [Lachnospiraceae bacterium]